MGIKRVEVNTNSPRISSHLRDTRGREITMDPGRRQVLNYPLTNALVPVVMRCLLCGSNGAVMRQLPCSHAG